MRGLRSRALAAPCAACLLFCLMPLRTAEPRDVHNLSTQDYIDIQQLVHRLNFSLDYCTRGGRDFADLFVAGGRFTIDRGDGNVKVVQTRDELIKLAGGPDCAALQSPPRAYLAHLADNLVIEPATGGARGKSYAIYPPRHGEYFQERFAGQVGLYFDEYVKTSAGWRFKSRYHAMNAASDNPSLLSR